jgi:hypothetical protein
MVAVVWPVMLGLVAVSIILATLWHYERERRQERWRIDNKHEQRMLAQLDADGNHPPAKRGEMVRYSDRWSGGA